MSKTALVVVDMQTGYEGTVDSVPLQERVKAAIRYAKYRRWDIINVTFVGEGPVIPEIAPLLKDTIQVRKKESDGGYYIWRKLRKLGIEPEKFVLCGIYGTDCVAQTAAGISRYYPGAQVLISKAISHGVDYKHQLPSGRSKKTWRHYIGAQHEAVRESQRYHSKNIKSVEMFGSDFRA
jgi:nicotinamidase-related amidase